MSSQSLVIRGGRYEVSRVASYLLHEVGIGIARSPWGVLIFYFFVGTHSYKFYIAVMILIGINKSQVR